MPAIPFGPAEFLAVFARYHAAVWPAPLVLLAIGLAMPAVARRRSMGAARLVLGALALLWAWMGAVYHLGFFRAINPAALIFGGMFLLQASLFAAAAVGRSVPRFGRPLDARSITGFVLLAYALLICPALGAMAGHGYPAGPSFGLPCPTTIFTFGLLLLGEGALRLRLLAVPLVWSAIGTVAALSLGMVEDLGLLAAAAAATYWFVRDRRSREPADTQRELVSNRNPRPRRATTSQHSPFRV